MADIVFPGEAPATTLGSTRLPSNVDLEFWKGDFQEFIFTFTDDTVAKNPINLTGMTPAAVMKTSFNSPTSYNFTCTVQNTNQVRVYLPSTVSKTIPAGEYVWNLQITQANGDVRTYVAGDVTVHAEVDS